MENQEQQVLFIIKSLEDKIFEHESPVFKKAVEWIERFPKAVDNALKDRLIKAICYSFKVTESDVWAAVAGIPPALKPVHTVQKTSEEKLRALLPRGGWFEIYDTYTAQNESPLSYHIFSSMCILGASLGRRCYIDMGHFRVYPNYAAVLIGPPGKVKKTSATDIARSIIDKAVLCPIMADKITAEAMATALKQSGHHFIYCPEFSVFFGRQKYNEGLTTQVIRLLDSPDKFSVQTQGRGEEIIENIALTMLGCTTPSLLAGSTPTEVTSSGFLSRFVLVVEETTDRCFPMPSKGVGEGKLLDIVNHLKAMEGQMRLDEAATRWHNEWYHGLWKRLRDMSDETQAEVQARSHTHMLRASMLIHMVQCDSFRICQSCMETAAKLLHHVEANTPTMLKTLRQATVSQDADFVFEQLVRLGGAADHSKLLRRVANRMNSTQFKQHIRTLEESGKVKVGKSGIAAYYTIIGVTDAVE